MNFCKCGCGKRPLTKCSLFLRGHHQNIKNFKEIIKQNTPVVLCACGCGTVVATRKAKYTLGHNPNSVHKTRSFSESQSKKMKLAWADPDRRKNWIKGQVVGWKDQDKRLSVSKKASRLMKDRWDDPEDREVLMEAILSPDRIKKISKTERNQFLNGLRKPSNIIKNCFKTGWLTTKKGGRFFYRSSWEKNRAKLYEICSSITKFEYEPFSVPYLFKGKVRAYFPDFLIWFKDGSKRLEEIKPKEKAREPEQLVKIKAGRKYCRNIGIQFLLVTNWKVPLVGVKNV